MPYLYDRIPGWFHASKLYDLAVERYQNLDDVHFVEIGSYFGRSTCYMIELLKEKKCNIKLDVIDPWKWDKFFDDVHSRVYKERVYRSDKLNEEHRKIVNEIGKDPFEITKYYLTSVLNENISLIQDTSINSVNRYKDGSLDFIYIDGVHSRDAVRKDINLYLPKLKKGGIISGDDFNCVGPIVNEILGEIELIGNSVTWRKNND